MYKQYTETFREIGKYIFFLEETILNYEQKCIDMGLEDMLEPSYSVCPVCKSNQKDPIRNRRNSRTDRTY